MNFLKPVVGGANGGIMTSALPPKVIAYVEDSSEDAVALSRVLEKAGVVNPVLHFRDAEELLEHLGDPSKPRPDVVLVDLSLPGLNGPEVIRAVKAVHPEMGETPMVIVTGHDEEYARQVAGLAGAEFYVAKPVTWFNLWEALLKASELHLEIVGQERRTGQPPTSFGRRFTDTV